MNSWRSCKGLIVPSAFTLTVIAVVALLPVAMPAAGQSPQAGSPAAAGLPSGVIVMWSGPLDAIPAGWALCDGSDGTPDLRNRFVLGVGAAEYLGSTGGAHSHQHRAREHIHQIDPPSMRLRSAFGNSGYGGGGARSHAYMFPGSDFDIRPFKSGPARAESEIASNLPPYLKLAFIMKL
jgi:hypothetical protein